MLDLGVALAGPFGAVQLANMGADVIKVNAPWDGWWMSTGIAFMANQGKRSVALNIQDERGLDVLRRMVAKADVVMHNMREGVGEHLKVDYESLLPYNPALVYCHSRGFDRTRYPVWRDWLAGAAAHPRRASVIERMRQARVLDLPGVRDGW